MIYYGNHLRESGLIREAWELRGHNLWCDCPRAEPCVADVLIAAVYEEWQGESSDGVRAEPWRKAPKKERSRWAGKALTALVATSGNVGRAAGLATTQLARDPPYALSDKLRWPQEAVIRAFVGYYLEGYFTGFTFPFIEDLVNAPPFTDYLDWKSSRGEVLGSQQPPQWVDRITTRKARGGQGIQLGAFSQSAARPPVVSFGLSADEHFSAARSAAAAALPSEIPRSADPELTMATAMALTEGKLWWTPDGKRLRL